MNDLLYARLPLSSPPMVVSDRDAASLAAKVRQAEETRRGGSLHEPAGHATLTAGAVGGFGAARRQPRQLERPFGYWCDL